MLVPLRRRNAATRFAFRDQVQHLDTEIRKGPMQHLDAAADRAGRVENERVVHHGVGSDELVDQIEVAAAQSLLEEPPHQRLVGS